MKEEFKGSLGWRAAQNIYFQAKMIFGHFHYLTKEEETRDDYIFLRDSLLKLRETIDYFIEKVDEKLEKEQT